MGRAGSHRRCPQHHEGRHLLLRDEVVVAGATRFETHKCGQGEGQRCKGREAEHRRQGRAAADPVPEQHRGQAGTQRPEPAAALVVGKAAAAGGADRIGRNHRPHSRRGAPRRWASTSCTRRQATP